MGENYIQAIVAILSGIATAIPLVCKLIQYVRAAVKEKNWDRLVGLTIGYMQTAEAKFSEGAAKKAWVLSMVQSSAKSINYDLDDESMQKISAMIDAVCAAAKTINVAVDGKPAEDKTAISKVQ